MYSPRRLIFQCLLSVGIIFVFVIIAFPELPLASDIEQGAKDPSLRMTESTCAESSYSFVVDYLFEDNRKFESGMLRFEHTWTDLPDTLVPGQPFNIRLAVDTLEQSVPDRDKLTIIGELRWATGVMVTAGRDYIARFLQNDSPIRIEYGTYRSVEPSPQLYIAKDVFAGFVIEEEPGPEHLSKSRWIESASTIFNDPVPERIPDKDTFTIPAANIDGELMLVVIYAAGLNYHVYVDVNFLYYFAKNPGGGGVWKLRTQFITTNVSYNDTVNKSKCEIELK